MNGSPVADAYDENTGILTIENIQGPVTIETEVQWIMPYDARVEYLQSNGSQYIDLGIKPQSTDIVTIKFQMVNSTAGIFFGSRYSDTSQKFTIGKSSAGYIFAALGSHGNVNLINYDTSVHEVVLNAQTVKASIDGCSDVSIGTFASNSYNMGLFGCNTKGTFAYAARVKIMELVINGRLELISVRKNGVGYMYDKLSGNLLGAATGTFAYGNDVI